MEEGEEGEEGAPMSPIDAFNEWSDRCEARLLSDLWGASLRDTKLQIGSKYLRGDGELVLEEVIRANTGLVVPPCDWSDMNYSYEDAELLAGHWGMSVSDTKFTMVNKVRVGNRSYLEQEMRASR